MSIRRAVGNLASGAVARIASAALGLLLVVVMSHIWDPTNFGRYIAAVTWFQLLQLVPLLGLHFQIARDAAAEPGDTLARLASASCIGLVCALVVAAAVAALAHGLAPHEVALPIALASLALIPSAPIAVAEMALLGQERMHLVALANTGESVLRFVVLGGLIAAGADVSTVLIGFIALRLATLVAYLADAAVRGALDPRAASRKATAEHLRRAPVLLVLLVLSSAFSRLDVALLPFLVGLAEVATYSIAARIYDLALMASSIPVMALLPIFSRLAAGGRQPETLAILALRYALALGIPLVFLGSWIAEPVLVIVFGTRFAAAADPLRFLLAATLVTGINQMMSCILLARDQQRLDLPCLAVGCVALVGGLFLLVPSLGLRGAGVAALVGALAQMLVRAVLLARTAGIVLLSRDLAAPLCGGLVASLVIAAGGATSHLAYPLAIAITAALALTSMRRGDFALLRGLVEWVEPDASRDRVAEAPPLTISALETSS